MATSDWLLGTHVVGTSLVLRTEDIFVVPLLCCRVGYITVLFVALPMLLDDLILQCLYIVLCFALIFCPCWVLSLCIYILSRESAILGRLGALVGYIACSDISVPVGSVSFRLHIEHAMTYSITEEVLRQLHQYI